MTCNIFSACSDFNSIEVCIMLVSLGRKIGIIIALAILGLFILHTTPGIVQMQPVSALQAQVKNSTMQGGGATMTIASTDGICASIANSGPKVTLNTLLSGDLDTLVLDEAGATLDAGTSSVCSFYASSIKFIESDKYVFGTDPYLTYQQGLVVEIRDAIALIVGSLVTLMWIFVGLNVMRGEAVTVSVPRMVLATVLALGAYPIASNIIDLESGMCASILNVTNTFADTKGIAAAGVDLVSVFVPVLGAVTDSNFATALPAVVVLLESIAVSFEMIIRIAAIDLLLVCSPVLVLYGLPQWQRWANLWVMSFLGLVFVQFLQVIAICLGAALVKSFAQNVDKGTAMGLLVGIAMLVLVLKIPSWFGGIVTSTLTGVATPYDLAGKAISFAIQAARK